MDENKKTRNGSLSKRHFAKLHESIQNKYLEMQKKIEHSRSMESIFSLNDDSTNSENKDNYLLTETRIDDKIIKYSVIEEDVNKQDANSKDKFNVPFYESEVQQKGNIEKEFLGNDFNNLCMESKEPKKDKKLEEVKGNRDEGITTKKQTHPPLTPQRVSLRDKIEEMFIEKRKENKEKRDKIEKLLMSKIIDLQESWKLERKNKVALVSVGVIHVSWPEDETSSDEKLFCCIRLGSEKRKTRAVKRVNNKNKWQELFNFSLFDEHILEATVLGRDGLLGRYSLDLSTLDKDKTHKINKDLEECSRTIKLLLLVTITAVPADNQIADDRDNEEVQKELEEMKRKWYLCELKSGISDVGWMTMKVYGAKGLAAADTYCSVELVNHRVRTHIVYSTTDPEWKKTFKFDIGDITSILFITVTNVKKSEHIIIGRLAIPLLKIENGKPRWYGLKDLNLYGRAKGNNPRIYLEMYVYYNPLKAALRVLTPKEEILLQEEPVFDRRLFAANVLRAKNIISWITSVFKIYNYLAVVTQTTSEAVRRFRNSDIRVCCVGRPCNPHKKKKECPKTIFECENFIINTAVLLVWLVFWWFYVVWMLPLFLIIPFIWYCPLEYNIFGWHKKSPSYSAEQEEVPLQQSIFQRISSLTDLVTMVQKDIGDMATMGECIKNLFNFSEPFVSTFAIILILLMTLILYLIPLRYLLMIWGINKYIRKLLWPKRVPNVEVIDMISRVPNDETLLFIQELHLEENDKLGRLSI